MISTRSHTVISCDQITDDKELNQESLQNDLNYELNYEDNNQELNSSPSNKQDYNIACEIKLSVKDLKDFGQSAYMNSSDGTTNFILDNLTYHIEKIFIRSILSAIGYQITNITQWEYEDSYQWQIETDLPFLTYIDILK